MARRVHALGHGLGTEEGRRKAAAKKGAPLKFRIYGLGEGRFTLYLGDTRIGGEKGIGAPEKGKLVLEFDVLPAVFEAAFRKDGR